MGRSRSLLARLGLVCCLLVPPLVHTGCVRDAAYQIRLEQAARKHVYDVSRSKLLAAVKHIAEEDGWTVEEGDGDGGPDLTGKPRERNGRKERLLVVLVKESDGFRVEADLEVDLKTANGKQHSTMRASALEIAVFSELDPKAADKAKVKAKAQAKEDAKMVRACARRAVDAATETED
ncbi:MAG: hypothetical protein JNL79_02550 [Myxococcales bacterium]|nr:hypothetical protein [Myxococcales bacterium]